MTFGFFGIIGTIFIIGILVFVHELGHFIAARKTGVKATEFAFGFGPRFISIRKLKTGFRINILNKIKFKIPHEGKPDETLYKINMLPLGGYVKMVGEEEGSSDDPRSFAAKSIPKRFAILIAGVVMNVILGIVIYYFLVIGAGFVYNLPKFIDTTYTFIGSREVPRVNIGDVVEGSPAASAGLASRDLIVSVEGIPVASMDEVAKIVDENLGKDIKMVVQQGFKRDLYEADVYARPNPPEGEGSMGIKMYESIDLNYSKNIFSKSLSGVSNSFNVMSFQLKSLAVLVKEAIATHDASPVADNVTGIVGIVSVTTAVINNGTLVDILDLTALLSLSIAFMNILPLPLLDGGYISLLALEKIRGKKVSDKAMEWYLRVGLFAVIILTVVITLKDIRQFEIFQGIKDLFS